MLTGEAIIAILEFAGRHAVDAIGKSMSDFAIISIPGSVQIKTHVTILRVADPVVVRTIFVGIFGVLQLRNGN
jgi:hypothetical protein